MWDSQVWWLFSAECGGQMSKKSRDLTKWEALFRKSDPGTAWARLSVLLKQESLCNALRIQVSDVQFRKKKLTQKNESLVLQIGPQISLGTYFYFLRGIPIMPLGPQSHLAAVCLDWLCSYQKVVDPESGRSWVESQLFHAFVCTTLRSHLTPELSCLQPQKRTIVTAYPTLWVGRIKWQSRCEEGLSTVKEIIVITVRMLPYLG